MAIKAQNQMTLIDLTDAYSVTLTNDNYTWLGDTDSVNGSQETTTQVMAMCGSEQVPCKIGEMTPPAGIAAVSDNKTPVPTITITATSDVTTGGSFDIPIEIGDGIVLHKVFSYSIAFTGKQGAAGAAGRGIKSATVEYQLSDSGTTAPTGEWLADPPAPTAGKYLWTRTTIVYTSGTPATSVLYSVSRSGADGKNGSPGAAGRGIKSITNYYLASKDGTGVTTATEGWTTTVQTMTATLKYLWNYEVIAYDDSSASTTTAPTIIGVYGATGAAGSPGAAGRGIKSITEYYLASPNATGITTATEGWTTELVTTTTTNKYLWNYEKIAYTDSTSEDTAPRIIGTHGATGAQGAKGDAGADAITLVITSSAGMIFKNTAIATTLTAHVYKAGAEVTGTALTSLGTIKWYKDGGTTAAATGATLTVAAGDVSNKVSYTAQLEG